MSNRIYAFEMLEVYHVTNQLARVLGGIMVSLPDRKKRVVKRLARAAILLAQGIAGGNAEMPPDEDLSPAERLRFLELSAGSVTRIRCTLLELRRQRCGNQGLIGAGLELLERIEAGLQENRAHIKPGFDPCEFARLHQRRMPS